MNRNLPRFLKLILVAIPIIGINSTSQAASRIIIKAVASIDYEKQRDSANKDQRTSYHFVEGKFFNGHANDKSLRTVSFFDIAENLSRHLVKDNYYPSRNAEKNDVALLVSWGITTIDDSIDEALGITSDEDYDELFPPSNVSENALGQATFEPAAVPNWGVLGKREASKMLGFWDTLHDRSLMPSDHFELQSLLNEERYFIVVVAFDNQKYRNGEKEILWVTRFSMRAAGISFDKAFPELTATASDYFGKNIKGLTKKRSDDNSSVELGDIEVLNTEKGSDNEP